MSIARRNRRTANRANDTHLAYLGELLCGFYELLSGLSSTMITGENIAKSKNAKYAPTDEQVKGEFNARNKKWQSHCAKYKLMNASHLFTMNVAEAWKRHTEPTK